MQQCLNLGQTFDVPRLHSIITFTLRRGGGNSSKYQRKGTWGEGDYVNANVHIKISLI